MFNSFFEDKYGQVKGERVKHNSKGAGEVAESMLVDTSDREQISKFVDMSSEHISKMVDEGHTLEEIMKCVVIHSSNKKLVAHVTEAVKCITLAALAKKRIGRNMTKEEMEHLRTLDLAGGTEFFRKIAEGE